MFCDRIRCRYQACAFCRRFDKICGNEGPYPTCRLAADCSALSGTETAVVSHSLGQLLTNAEENIRVGAVRLLPRFPAGFAEQALRERAGNKSANVRSVAADVIGEEEYVLAPTDAGKALRYPVGRYSAQEPLTMDYLRAGQRWNNIGDVHTSAGFALVKFDFDQVGGILRSNLSDPGFHINFVSKLAEGDAKPWLPELVSILEARLKHVDEILKLPADDPEEIWRSVGRDRPDGHLRKVLGGYRQYLLKLPPEKL